MSPASDDSGPRPGHKTTPPGEAPAQPGPARDPARTGVRTPLVSNHDRRPCAYPLCDLGRDGGPALFAPRQATQKHCCPDHRRAAWRLDNPTFRELVEMDDARFAAAVLRLFETRGAEEAGRDSGLMAPLASLVGVPEPDLRRLVRRVMESRHPDRRGRLRVRFGHRDDEPMTDGVI